VFKVLTGRYAGIPEKIQVQADFHRRPDQYNPPWILWRGLEDWTSCVRCTKAPWSSAGSVL